LNIVYILALTIFKPNYQIETFFTFVYQPRALSGESCIYNAVYIFNIQSVLCNGGSVIINQNLWNAGYRFYLQVSGAFHIPYQCPQPVRVLRKCIEVFTENFTNNILAGAADQLVKPHLYRKLKTKCGARNIL